MQQRLTIVTLITLGFVAAAQAGVTMSFADPIPGQQLHHKANGAGPGLGSLSFDTTAQLAFLFDGSDEGLPNHVFTDAYMELDMTLGPSSTSGGITTAPVAGFFRIYDASGVSPALILTGTAAAGTLVRISDSNALLFSSPEFSYTAGAALLAITGPITFGARSDGVFTLTNVIGHDGAPFINPDGTFNSFHADSSYSGSSALVLIPNPASIALGLTGLGALCVGRRRWSA